MVNDKMFFGRGKRKKTTKGVFVTVAVKPNSFKGRFIPKKKVKKLKR